MPIKANNPELLHTATTTPIPSHYIYLAPWKILLFEYPMLLLALFFVCLRMYMRPYKKRKMLWSDIMVCLAWCFTLFWVIIDTIRIKIGWYKGGAMGINHFLIDKKSQVIGYKLLFAYHYAGYPSLYCVKFSMLFLYNELINRSAMFKTWIVLLALFAYTTIGLAYQMAMYTFWCPRISDNWHRDRPGACLPPGFNHILGMTWSVFDFSSDLFIYVFPIFLVRQLKLRRRVKIGVYLVFCIGFVAVVNSFAYYFVIFFDNDKSTWWLNQFLFLWEQTWAIFVACSPALKSMIMSPCLGTFFRKLAFWKPSECLEEKDAENGGKPERAEGFEDLPTIGGRGAAARSVGRMPGDSLLITDGPVANASIVDSSSLDDGKEKAEVDVVVVPEPETPPS